MIIRFFTLCLLISMFSCGGPDADISSSSSSLASEGIEDTNPFNDPRPLDSILRLETPRPNDELSSPFPIKGDAITSFFYEGKMHYLITDEKGKAVGEGYVKAEQFIMKDGIVTFNDSISFDAPAGTKGFLRLTNNAASQQAGFQRSMTIPVVLK